MKYKSGRVYEGDWIGDLRHGRGYERYENWNIYMGQFHTGKAHGQGNYSWKATGEVYDGEWVRGIRQGYGMWKSIKGDSYLGEWKNGKACGYGVFTWSNGDKYEGEWGANLKHGKGADYFNNGDNYRGEYKGGKPDGHGIYTWANGSSYDGNFKNGLKYGKGIWKKAPDQPGGPRNEYIGEYIDDKKCGQGEFKWASGNSYKGGYKDDERDGHGQMTWTDGSKYIGEWIKGIQHGYGKMIFPDGSVKEGYFESNVYVGHVPTHKNQQQQQQQQYKTPMKTQSNFLKQTEQQLNSKRIAEIQRAAERSMYNNSSSNQGTISGNHAMSQERKQSDQRLQQASSDNVNSNDFYHNNDKNNSIKMNNGGIDNSSSQAKMLMRKRLENNQSSTSKLRSIQNHNNQEDSGKRSIFNRNNSVNSMTHEVKLKKLSASSSLASINNGSNGITQTNGFYSPDKLKRQIAANQNNAMFQHLPPQGQFQQQFSRQQHQQRQQQIYPGNKQKSHFSPSENAIGTTLRLTAEDPRQTLQAIQKPKFDQISALSQPLRLVEINHDSPGVDTIALEVDNERNQQQSRNGGEADIDSVLYERRVKKRRKEGKYLVTGKRMKNSSSHKLLPMGNLSGTRFFDQDYHQSNNYNLSLS